MKRDEIQNKDRVGREQENETANEIIERNRSASMSIWKCDIPMVIPGRFGVCPLLTYARSLARLSPFSPLVR